VGRGTGTQYVVGFAVLEALHVGPFTYTQVLPAPHNGYPPPQGCPHCCTAVRQSQLFPITVSFGQSLFTHFPIVLLQVSCAPVGPVTSQSES
jgi:hypothetical protein